MGVVCPPLRLNLTLTLFCKRSYEFRAGWKPFAAAWRVSAGDTVLLERHTPDRSKLHIKVRQRSLCVEIGHPGGSLTRPGGGEPHIKWAFEALGSASTQCQFGEVLGTVCDAFTIRGACARAFAFRHSAPAAMCTDVFAPPRRS